MAQPRRYGISGREVSIDTVIAHLPHVVCYSAKQPTQDLGCFMILFK